MHVLTKIFIVLVSLLAILLVPLVVVYAHNEDSFKAKFEDKAAEAAATYHNYQVAQLAAQQIQAEFQLQINDLMSENEDLAREKERLAADIRTIQADLADARSRQSAAAADITTLTSAVSAGQDVNKTLLTEVRTMRTEAMDAERRSVELDEALRDITGQLQAAEAARRAMEEELNQLKTEHASALQEMAAYVEKYGPLEAVARGPTEVTPTRDLDARVVSVRRSADRVLAEINAGSRDGVQEGWVMQIGRGGTFVGNLRIIAVDINNATGIVEHENPETRGAVEQGDHVYARRTRS